MDINAFYSLLLNRYEVPTDLVLSPAQRANFTMLKTLIGENDTRLPDNATRSLAAWFEYRDAIGPQTVKAIA
jgi:hypothetical protein